MQTVRSGQRRTRAKRARQNPQPVAVRYVCPRCGRDHRADEHGVANLSDFRRLDAPALRQLRADVLEELGAAVVARAEPAHVERVAALLAAARAARAPRRLTRCIPAGALASLAA